MQLHDAHDASGAVEPLVPTTLIDDLNDDLPTSLTWRAEANDQVAYAKPSSYRRLLRRSHEMGAELPRTCVAMQMLQVDLTDSQREPDRMRSQNASPSSRDKNWAEADTIRDELLAQGIQLKDGKDPVSGERVTTWEVKR